MSNYDVVVIGSGPGGYVAAIHAAQAGHKTAIVEVEATERLGGTCLLRGCIPTKAMLHTADLLDDMRKSESFGIVSEAPKLDMSKMDAYRGKVIKKNSGGVQYLMKKNKIDVHLGHGRLAGRNKVSVTTPGGEVTTLDAKFVILATGSATKHLPFLPVDGEHIIDSDHLLATTVLPEHLLVLGAGAVGSEFASVFLRYGSKVTLIEMQDRILPIEDEEVSREAEKIFKRQGMDVRTGSKLTDARVEGGTVHAVIEGPDGSSEQVQASHLLVAVGRRPVSDDVGLDGTKVQLDERGDIVVDESTMRTGEDWVYAIGDVINTPWLAHVAYHEAELAVNHLSGKETHAINYDRVPNCTYCTPEVASVGLTEKRAVEAGYEVNVGKFPFSAIGKASIVGHPEGFVKIVADAQYGEILGMHIVGPKATELITEGTVAMNLESTVEEIVHSIHPHPTLSEAVKEAAHAVLGHTIHM